MNTLLLFPFFDFVKVSLLSFKLQFNRLHSLTWILSIKIRTFGACGGVRTHPVHPPWLRACSMIVPVWLSSSRSNEEVLAYAILDTQSDATFILKEICDDLDVEMQPTKLRLSTITNHESLVDSHRITDLHVRDYNSDIQIPIPVAYTSTSIPANENHIQSN